MIYIKTLVVCIISVFVLTDSNFIPKSDIFAQVISNNLEESDVYMQLSNILDNTEKNLDDVVQAINAGENDNALNIISNITMNIKEIENGLDLIVDNPIHGGD
jgi:predicted patatin/cPLA2 family phospholipase